MKMLSWWSLACILGVLFSIPAAVAQNAAPAETYCWPLDLPRVLTSSFGEYRTGRFHAGIDLRTNGVGRDIHAADDGHVARILCSPYGYGKAVYLELKDGRTVVYGHLSDYNDALRAYVRAAQHAKKSYSVELFPKADEFPVKRGELIAKNGDTGIGGPHLHYEIRDSAQRPLNPVVLGISWPDAVRPVVHKAVLAPEGPDGTVNGGYAPVVLEAQAAGPGQWRCAPVRVSGKIGVGVEADDPGTEGAVLGVYRMRLLDGANEAFMFRHDLLDYDTIRNGVVGYHPYLMEKGRFQVLWRWPGNICDSYAHCAGDGWLEAGTAPREVTVAIEDFRGNAATLTIPLVPDATEPAAPGAGGTGTGQVNVECLGNYLWVEAAFSAPESETPVLLADAAGQVSRIPFRRLDAMKFQAAWAPVASGAYTLNVEHPRVKTYPREVSVARQGEAARTLALGEVSMGVDPGSPYGLLFARCYPPTSSSPAPAPKLGPEYRLWPMEAPINVPVTVSFPAPAGIEQEGRAAVYAQSRSGWNRMETERGGGRFSIKTRSFGTFAVMEDKTPPRISGVAPEEHAATASLRPEISASVGDDLSGVAAWEIACDGKWLLAGFDPEGGKIFWERDEDLAAGDHRVSFTVTDAAGNVARVERAVSVGVKAPEAGEKKKAPSQSRKNGKK